MDSNESLNGKSLKERFLEYLANPKDNLRAQLIEAVSLHEGWEESAIALVDEAILPVVRRHHEGRPAVEGKPLELMTRDELLAYIKANETGDRFNAEPKLKVSCSNENAIRQHQAEQTGGKLWDREMLPDIVAKDDWKTMGDAAVATGGSDESKVTERLPSPANPSGYSDTVHNLETRSTDGTDGLPIRTVYILDGVQMEEKDYFERRPAIKDQYFTFKPKSSNTGDLFYGYGQEDTAMGGGSVQGSDAEAESHAVESGASPASGFCGEISEHLRVNIAKAIECTITYYKAEVGDRMSNVYDVTDAVLREVKPYLRQPVPVLVSLEKAEIASGTAYITTVGSIINPREVLSNIANALGLVYVD